MKNKIFAFLTIMILSALLPLSVFADNTDIEKLKTAYEEAQFSTESIRDELMQAKSSYEYAQQHPDEEGMQDILASYPDVIAQTEKSLTMPNKYWKKPRPTMIPQKDRLKQTPIKTLIKTQIKRKPNFPPIYRIYRKTHSLHFLSRRQSKSRIRRQVHR